MLESGKTIELLAPVVPWYSGYGDNPVVCAYAGTLGKIKSVNVPAVRKIKGKPLSYFTAELEIDGERWMASFHEKDENKTWKLS
jgi:hypothetical protein